jgi:hypothetical protein
VAVRIEYVGFTSTDRWREYRLRVQEGADPIQDFVVAIANEAFATRQARYQDAPDICYQVLLKALEASPVPTRRLTLSPEDLLHYTVAHSQKPATRRAAAGRPVPREPNAAPAFTSKPWRP